MKNGLVSSLRDEDGAHLIEFTLVFPVLILVLFGTVDVTLYLFDWAKANKAAYLGARQAVVSSPVAQAITDIPYTPASIGQNCFRDADGNASGSCPAPASVCTATSSPAGTCLTANPTGTCTN